MWEDLGNVVDRRLVVGAIVGCVSSSIAVTRGASAFKVGAHLDRVVQSDRGKD